jgi:hypothetical protein
MRELGQVKKEEYAGGHGTEVTGNKMFGNGSTMKPAAGAQERNMLDGGGEREA